MEKIAISSAARVGALILLAALSWSPRAPASGSAGVGAVAVDPLSPDTIYAVDGDGVVKSSSCSY